MSACNCTGGPNCCRNAMYRRYVGNGMVEVREYWPDGACKSWRFELAAPHAAAPMVPSPSEVFYFDGGGSRG